MDPASPSFVLLEHPALSAERMQARPSTCQSFAFQTRFPTRRADPRSSLRPLATCEACLAHHASNLVRGRQKRRQPEREFASGGSDGFELSAPTLRTDSAEGRCAPLAFRSGRTQPNPVYLHLRRRPLHSRGFALGTVRHDVGIPLSALRAGVQGHPGSLETGHSFRPGSESWRLRTTETTTAPTRDRPEGMSNSTNAQPSSCSENEHHDGDDGDLGESVCNGLRRVSKAWGRDL